jgi:hypothetical protein
MPLAWALAAWVEHLRNAEATITRVGDVRRDPNGSVVFADWSVSFGARSRGLDGLLELLDEYEARWRTMP